jgi:hypothetical protein
MAEPRLVKNWLLLSGSERFINLDHSTAIIMSDPKKQAFLLQKLGNKSEKHVVSFGYKLLDEYLQEHRETWIQMGKLIVEKSGGHREWDAWGQETLFANTLQIKEIIPGNILVGGQFCEYTIVCPDQTFHIARRKDDPIEKLLGFE